MTYLLTDDLPSTVSVNGVPFEVETDFRLFVAFERDAFCERWGDTEALETLLRFYPGGIPADVQAALTASSTSITAASLSRWMRTESRTISRTPGTVFPMPLIRMTGGFIRPSGGSTAST